MIREIPALYAKELQSALTVMAIMNKHALIVKVQETANTVMEADSVLHVMAILRVRHVEVTDTACHAMPAACVQNVQEQEKQG